MTVINSKLNMSKIFREQSIRKMYIGFETKEELESILLHLDVFDVSWMEGQRPFDYKPTYSTGTLRVLNNNLTVNQHNILENSLEKDSLNLSFNEFIKLIDNY